MEPVPGSETKLLNAAMSTNAQALRVELSGLERDWARFRASFRRLPNEPPEIPSRLDNLPMALLLIAFGVIQFSRSLNSYFFLDSPPWLAPIIHPVASLAMVLGGCSLIEFAFRRARLYQQTQDRYQSRRAELLTEIDAAKETVRL